MSNDSYNRVSNPFKNKTTNVDFDLSFLKNPATNDLRTLSNLDSVKQSIMTLLFTNRGERPFQPNLACNMQQMLFSQLDPISKIQLQREIYSTLNAYESRIKVLAVDVTQSANPNGLNISIRFQLVNSPNVETISLFLTETR